MPESVYDFNATDLT